MKRLIKKLVESYGPPGGEETVRNLVRSEIQGRAEVVEISPLGSLHAIMNKGGDAKVMLAAHMDEIGVIISHVDQRGYARFQPLGEIDPGTLLGRRLRFQNGSIGAIGLEKERSAEQPPGLGHFFIDFGAVSPDRCPVSTGDIGAFEGSLIELGDRLVAKSMDDRIGVAILIETLRRIQNPCHELQFAFTVQEEVGLRGATTSAYRLAPDLGIAVDVTGAGDLPGADKTPIALGKGPAIQVRDRRMISDPRIVDLMVKRAQSAGIGFQMEVTRLGGNDAAAIQLARAGIPAAAVSIPTRYMHTASEMVDYNDVENTIGLLLEILTKPIAL